MIKDCLIAYIVRIWSIALKVINSSILCTHMMWHSRCLVEKLLQHPVKGRHVNNCSRQWHIAPWPRWSPSCFLLNDLSSLPALILPLVFTAVEVPASGKNSRLHFWQTLSQTNTSLCVCLWEGASHKHFHTTLQSCGYVLYVVLWFTVCMSHLSASTRCHLNWKLFFAKAAHSWSFCTPLYMRSPDHDWNSSHGEKTW